MKLINRFKIKQFNLGVLVGGVRFQAANSMFYMSGVSLFFSSSAAYEQITTWFPFVSYWMVIAFIFLVFFGVMLMEHVFIYRSTVTYMTRQSYGRHNPTIVLLQNMDAKLDLALAEIDKLKGESIDEKETGNHGR